MATRTRAQLRTLVRTQLDMDVIELPDATLDPWFEDGFERSLAVDERWPFFEYTWTFTTVASQVAYTRASIAALNSNTNIEQVTAVMDVTSYPIELQGISHDSARHLFGLGAGGGGVPAYWSEWKSSIELWQAPSVGRLMSVDGYRKPSWAAGDAIAPDCDERLHLCLYFFACAMAYAQQEDEVLSAEYLKHWQAALTQAHSKIMASPQRRPIILSGGVSPVPSAMFRLP